jgi:membrane-bound serine protease (ClpP class)
VRRLSRPRALTVAAGVVLCITTAVGTSPPEIGAQTTTSGVSGPSKGGGGQVLVVSVSGLIDPIVADFLASSIADAEKAGAVAVVLQVDLEGSALTKIDLYQVINGFQLSKVPVYLWIGPTGSSLTGDAALLVSGVQRVSGSEQAIGVAPGTHLGDIRSQPYEVFGIVDFKSSEVQKAWNDKWELLRGTLDDKQAEDAHLAVAAPTIGDFIVNLPGVQSEEVTQGDQTRRKPVTQVVFTQLPIWASLMHAAASPPVAYLLLTIGLALIIFELFTAGVGVAGVCGAVSFVLACYGLAALPTHWYGIALIVGSMLAFAIDVQTGVPRVWTGVGIAAFTVGSLTIYNGVSMSWVTISAGIVMVLLAFLAGMPSMVRARFSTPTIGRDWMIGELGKAVTDVSPDGVVEIRGAQWRAITNRATPIDQLDRVRVTAIDGLVLEVEPEEGGARDYRSRG